ncbi:hypothetical protein AY601_4077 [Pedobacter cryoconitis]|uniref:Uncharacterized protein n=1 Tax=Pedobacter cryoconitis TaxID=188932 RepID=A0A127VI34_9SPHI|nr:hypothetical protein [Pedobacter cryoconitis]AMQ00928.1 hypothetical protein AY601_4077 [Pedobacter cryoconitis]
MNRVQTALRNLAVNGVISLPEALKIAQRFDEDEEESLNLITRCKTQVGMDLGGDIRAHEAKLKGTFFNEKNYHFERLPEGQ